MLTKMIDKYTTSANNIMIWERVKNVDLLRSWKFRDSSHPFGNVDAIRFDVFHPRMGLEKNKGQFENHER